MSKLKKKIISAAISQEECGEIMAIAARQGLNMQDYILTKLREKPVAYEKGGAIDQSKEVAELQQKVNDLTKQLTTKAPILKEPVVNANVIKELESKIQKMQIAYKSMCVTYYGLDNQTAKVILAPHITEMNRLFNVNSNK